VASERACFEKSTVLGRFAVTRHAGRPPDDIALNRPISARFEVVGR